MEYKYIIESSKDQLKNTYNKIHPKLEIIRGKIIQKFFDRFYNILNNQHEIQRHKSDEIITRFCWSNITYIDPVLPFHELDDYNTIQLQKDLHNYKYDDSVIIALKIFKFFNFYHKYFDKIYHSIDTHSMLIKIKIKDHGSYLQYKKYKVNYNKYIMDSLNTFYNGKYNGHVHTLYFVVLYRYNLLDGDGQQLSILPQFKLQLKKTFGINIELFGSCINRTYDSYCSLFYDIEQYFGSLGNFYNMKIEQGFYVANPPFDEEIMKTMATRFITFLDDATQNKNPLGFLITIPVWDYAVSKKQSRICKTSIAYDVKYECYEILKNSKYMSKCYELCKNDFKYYNIKNNAIIGAVNTFVIILKNDHLKIDMLQMDKIIENI